MNLKIIVKLLFSFFILPISVGSSINQDCLNMDSHYKIEKVENLFGKNLIKIGFNDFDRIEQFNLDCLNQSNILLGLYFYPKSNFIFSRFKF